jgi:hypothetical protein
VIVEIGSLYGRSSCAMGFACVGTRRRIYCIDPWKYAELGDLDFFEQWRANITVNRLEAHVFPLRGRSHDMLSHWNELTGGLPVDFVFIDGWHEYASVLRDFELAFPLVKTGGWIALHDVCPDWPGPSQVWEQTAGPTLTGHERCSTIACGRKHASRIVGAKGVLTERATRSAPDVHYFSEVGPGDDYRRQLATLRRLDFPWRWHLVTTEPSSEARAIAREEPRVAVHIANAARGLESRVEGLSAVLRAIPDECILWRIEPDDGWSPAQLVAGRAMLLDDNRRTALAIRAPAGVRAIAWHCHPWFRWTNPADPFLGAFLADGTVVDVGRANPVLVEHGASQGLLQQAA